MAKHILKTIFYTGLLLSIRTLFQRQPRWLQISFVILAGVVLGSVISLKLYGFIMKDIVHADSRFLEISNIIICSALFALLTSFFSYCLYLLLVKKWISLGMDKSRDGLFEKISKPFKKQPYEGKEYKPCNLSNAPIEEVLANASEEQLLVLSRILKVGPNKHVILQRVCFLGQSKSKYFIRNIFKKEIDADRIYKELVRRTARKLRIKHLPFETTSAIEVKISQKVIKTVWERLTPDQKKELEDTLRREADKYDKKADLIASGSIFASLTAAKLSGLGVYILASTALSALQIGVGSLAYTALSSAFSIIIGPVGWIGAGLFTIWKLDQPNFRKIIPAMIFISAMRTGYK